MAVGSFLKRIPGLFGINDQYPVSTPPFVGEGDQEAYTTQPPASPPSSKPPALDTPQSAPPPLPSLDSDTQRYLDVARKGSPMHPQHGTLRNVGEGLAEALIGRNLGEKIFDRDYARQKAQYQHDLQDAALASQIYQKGTANTAGTANTYGEARLRNKEVENYDANLFLKAIEHGGEYQPGQPQGAPPPLSTPGQPSQATPPQGSAPAREGSTVPMGGRNIFFPSPKTRVLEAAQAKKQAEQDTYRPLPAEVTKTLNLPPDIKVPPNEVDSYLRIYEKKTTDPNLKFDSYVDENNGNVTTVGRDVRTGEVKFKDTIKGIAAKRPQVTAVSIPGLGPAMPGANSQAIGEEFLTSLPPGTAAQVKAIAEGRAAMPPLGTRGAGAQIRDAVYRYDPQFSEQRAQIRRAFTAGPDGKNIGSLNTAAVHLDQLDEVAKAMQNGSFQPGNQLWNTVRATFGSSAPTNFETLKAAVAGEMANALKGNATDIEIGTMSKNLQAANSPRQLADAIQENLRLLGGKLNTYQERYAQQIPGDTSWSPVLPSALAVFDKHGLNPTAGPQANIDRSGGRSGASGSGAQPKAIVQHSTSTGQYRYSTDGGKTWLPGQPPNR